MQSSIGLMSSTWRDMDKEFNRASNPIASFFPSSISPFLPFTHALAVTPVVGVRAYVTSINCTKYLRTFQDYCVYLDWKKKSEMRVANEHNYHLIDYNGRRDEKPNKHCTVDKFRRSSRRILRKSIHTNRIHRRICDWK